MTWVYSIPLEYRGYGLAVLTALALNNAHRSNQHAHSVPNIVVDYAGFKLDDVEESAPQLIN